MSTIFSLENVNASNKINIDELYDKKKQMDLNNLKTFDKIVNRIHLRIKYTARQNADAMCCWFVVPEFILGIPRYDHALCIAYAINKLKQNDFQVKYYHPNALFISWRHYIPSYVRSEFKKKTGIQVNEFGEVVEEADKQNQVQNQNLAVPEIQFHEMEEEKTKSKTKPYTPIKPYKPSFFNK